MKLYFFPASTNCRKPLLVAKHLGLDIENQLVDVPNGEGRSAEYLAINPNGKVPTLTDGTTTLWESNAICCYLASQMDNSLWPKSALRYDILRWMFWEGAHWSPALAPLIFEHVVKGGKDVDHAALDVAAGNVARFGAVLDGVLKGRDWVVGDGITLADYVLGAALMYQEPAKMPLEDFKHLMAWADRVRATDAWRGTEPRMG